MTQLDCSKCGKPLTLLNPEFARRRSDARQYADALEVYAMGGYGMLIDPGSYAEAPHGVLCAECGTAFLADNPWLQPLHADVA